MIKDTKEKDALINAIRRIAEMGKLISSADFPDPKKMVIQKRN